MTISIEALRAMVAAGADAKTLVDVIEADQRAFENKLEARRESNRLRQQRHRLSRDVTPVTRDTVTPEQNQQLNGVTVSNERSINQESLSKEDSTLVSKKESLRGKEVGSKRLGVAAPSSESHFLRFWEIRARRKGSDPRAPCENKFKALVRGGEDPEAIISGMAAHADAMRFDGTFGTEFVMQTIRFLNQRHYRDYLAKFETTGPPQPDPDAKIGASGKTRAELLAFYSGKLENGQCDKGLSGKSNGVHQGNGERVCSGEKDPAMGGVGGLFPEDDGETSIGDDKSFEGLH